MDDSDTGVKLTLSDIKSHVSKVNFIGLNRTKRDILYELVEPLLATKNVSEVYLASQRVRNRFGELGLFRNCAIYIDESNNSSPDSSITNLNIEFNVEETGRITGGVLTSVGQNGASLTLQLNTPNVIGRGEQFSVRAEQSFNGDLSFCGTASKPLVKNFEKLNWHPRFDFSVFQNQMTFPWSKYFERDRGFNFDFVTQTETGQSHLVRFESLWKYAHSRNDTPIEVRKDFGHSVKYAVRYEYICDWRNHLRFPTSGLLFRFTNELAHFQKDNPDGFVFGKNEVELQQNISLFRQISFQASFKFGFLRPIFGGHQRVPINECFFLGGPLNLRGFELNSAGPTTKKLSASLGGNAYWLAGLHLYFPIPLRNQLDEMLRFHGFLNVGNITQELKIDRLLGDFRASTGAGIVATFGHNYRLEVNYCLPFKQKSTDKSQNFQFGVGVFYS